MFEFKDGLTAVMLNRDELVFEKCLLSILPIVDRVIVIDASTKLFIDDVKEICSSYDKVVYRHMLPNVRKQCKISIGLVDTKWIVTWDADFEAISNSYNVLHNLIDNVVDKRKRCFYLSVKNMSDESYHSQGYLFSNSRNLNGFRLIKVYNKLNSIRKGVLSCRRSYNPLPYYYLIMKPLTLMANHHDNMKTDNRIIERRYQDSWALISEKDKGNMTFEEYIVSGVVFDKIEE